MLRALTQRLTYANVCATLALFIALGGAGYAAVTLPANSVGTRQLKKHAVTKAKVDTKLLAALKGKTGPAGPPGTPNGYTQAQADARFAQAVGGRIVSAAATIDPDVHRPAFLSVPGLGRVGVDCIGGPAIKTEFVNTSSRSLHVSQRRYAPTLTTVDVQQLVLSPNAFAAQYFAPGDIQFELLVSAAGAGPVATVQIAGATDTLAGKCRFAAQATVSAAG